MKPILIIDVEKNSVNAGVFEAKKLEPVYSVSEPRDGVAVEAALGAAVEKILARGFTDFSRVVAGLDPAEVSLREVALPFDDAKKVEQAVAYEVEDSLAYSIEDVVLDSIGLAEARTLAATVEKKTLKRFLDKLGEYEIDPQCVTSSLFSKPYLLKGIYNGEETSALVDSVSITIVKQGRPYLLKHLRDAADLRLALARLESMGVVVERFYSTASAAAELGALGVENVVELAEPRDGHTGISALAEHLKAGLRTGESINFRLGEFSNTREAEEAKKGLKTTFVVLAVCAVLWAGHLYMHNAKTRSDIAAINQRLKAEYLELMPGRTVVADPLYQLEVDLKMVKQERAVLGSAVKPLRVMRLLAEGKADIEEIRLYELHIFGERFSAAGETGSFEEANRFRDSLSKLPGLADIALSDVKSKAGGGVRFSISATITLLR